jgi:GT2 family glycosyltransferase
VELIRNDANLGYAAGNNRGIRRALERGADWVLLLNNDVVVDSGIVDALAGAAGARPDAGVLACKVLFASDPTRIEFAGADFNALLGYSGRQRGYGRTDDGDDGALRDIGRGTGAAMAVSRRAIDAAGLFDEQLFLYVEDTDLCLRIRASGAAIVYVPNARVWHEGGAAGGGRASASALYYHARNTLAVAERHRPLPPLGRAARRGVIVGTHLLQAGRDPAAVRAVLAGWRDYRAGRMGARA